MFNLMGHLMSFLSEDTKNLPREQPKTSYDKRNLG